MHDVKKKRSEEQLREIRERVKKEKRLALGFKPHVSAAKNLASGLGCVG
jgi:hypothetical protein